MSKAEKQIFVPDLLATCWTTAGTSKPAVGDELSPLSLQYRIETASKLGWQGFGILHADLMRGVQELGVPGLKKLISDNGIQYVELECINDWFTSGSRREKSDYVRKNLLNLAAELEAIHVKMGSETDGSIWPWEKLVEEAHQLGVEAQAAGTRIAIEFLPFSQIDSLETGVKLVDEVNHSAVGLLLDIWHVVHGHTPFEVVARLPKRYIFGIELNDALLKIENDLFYDTVHNRMYCGEGEFKVSEFIAAILATGYEGPYGVEILSDEHRSLGLDEALTRARDTALAQFIKAQES